MKLGGHVFLPFSTIFLLDYRIVPRSGIFLFSFLIILIQRWLVFKYFLFRSNFVFTQYKLDHSIYKNIQS